MKARAKAGLRTPARMMRSPPRLGAILLSSATNAQPNAFCASPGTQTQDTSLGVSYELVS